MKALGKVQETVWWQRKASRGRGIVRWCKTPSTRGTFERYAATIVEHTSAAWTAEPGQPFDLGPEMNELALEIISKLVFGEDWSRQASELRESIQIIRRSMVREATASIVLPDWLPLPSKMRLKRALAVINEQVWKRFARGANRPIRATICWR